MLTGQEVGIEGPAVDTETIQTIEGVCHGIYVSEAPSHDLTMWLRYQQELHRLVIATAMILLPGFSMCMPLFIPPIDSFDRDDRQHK